jgi:DNA-binding MarR family transcriptional regulator
MEDDKPRHLILSLEDKQTIRFIEKVVRESFQRDDLLKCGPLDDVDDTDGSEVPKAALRSAARILYLQRRHRLKIFSQGMFGEPAWDMLLSLYSLSDTVAAMSVGRLCSYSGAPPTTALRWLDYLTGQGLMKRSEAHNDKRKAMISITPKAEADLDRYFRHLLANKRDAGGMLDIF